MRIAKYELRMRNVKINRNFYFYCWYYPYREANDPGRFRARSRLDFLTQIAMRVQFTEVRIAAR